jgi:hypothetical protein
MQHWQIKLALWLIRRAIKSRRQLAQKSNGSLLVSDGTNPCQLQIDALDAAAVDVDNALAVLQDRAMALMMCQMENMQR